MTQLTVRVNIKSQIDKVWTCWTEPKHITKWNFASDDWHTPYAENDLRPGGKFLWRMEAKDGSFGFDFAGTYEEVRPLEFISYSLGDIRKVKIEFIPNNGGTDLIETFDAEDTNSLEQQRQGWQAILNNFKAYVEQD